MNLRYLKKCGSKIRETVLIFLLNVIFAYLFYIQEDCKVFYSANCTVVLIYTSLLIKVLANFFELFPNNNVRIEPAPF